MFRRLKWSVVLLLATSLPAGCQHKREWPRITRVLRGERANPLIILGNGAAYGRIVERFRSR